MLLKISTGFGFLELSSNNPSAKIFILGAYYTFFSTTSKGFSTGTFLVSEIEDWNMLVVGVVVVGFGAKMLFDYGLEAPKRRLCV